MGGDENTDEVVFWRNTGVRLGTKRTQVFAGGLVVSFRCFVSLKACYKLQASHPKGASTVFPEKMI